MGQTQAVKNYGVYHGEPMAGESQILRSEQTPHGTNLRQYPADGILTMLQAYQNTVGKQGNKNWLGTREKLKDGEFGKYKWRTFNSANGIIKNLARGILKLDLAPLTEHGENEHYKFLGIYGKNTEEWVMTEIACWHISTAIIPLYDTLGEEALEFITQQTALRTIVLSEDKISNVLKSKRENKMESVKTLVCMEDVEENIITEGRELGVQIISFATLTAEGAKVDLAEASLEYCSPKSLALVCYTSGTTGEPKGVQITHSNLLAAAAGGGSLPTFHFLTNDDAVPSYLPLAHMYEQQTFCIQIICGAKYGFYQGNILKLTEDLAELKPTAMCSVPRLFNRFFSIIKGKIDETTGYKKALLNKAIKTKMANLKSASKFKHVIYDPIVFKKMRNVLGGRMKLLVSGAAPIEGEVLDLLKICFSCPIVEGYGQTENAAAGTVSGFDDNLSGHIGAPYACTEIKLIDIPEMEYYTKDRGVWEGQEISMPRGEILMRGPSCSPGYFKAPQKNKETFINGWLHTGDIGIFLPGGRIKIIDRKNNVFKLQQGEFIAAEKLENIYVMSPFVSQIFVYGDGLKTFLIAIIVVEPAHISKVAKAKNLEFEIEALCKNSIIIEECLNSLKELAKLKKLSGLEKIKKVYLTSQPFSVENGTLTPSLKIKRKPAIEYYKEEIENLYS